MVKKLLLILLFCLMAVSGWAANTGILLTAYVDTNLGTDDVNHGNAAGTGAYATLAYAESEQDRDLTTGDYAGNMVINCAGTTADTTSVVITGWTTDATHYIEINGDYAVTSGVHYSTNYYRLESGAFAISNYEENVRFNNIQIKNSGTALSYGIINRSVEANWDIRINRCVLVGAIGEIGEEYGIRSISSTGTSTVLITNCIIYGWGSDGINNDDADIVTTIENCTISGCIHGIDENTGVTNIINCAVFNNTVDYGNVAGSVTYSASDDAQAGTGNVDISPGATESTEWAKAFIDYVNYDFHIKDTSSLIYNTGTDLYGSGVTTDIDNDVLTVRNDIGADEYVAAASTTPPFFSIINVGD